MQLPLSAHLVFAGNKTLYAPGGQRVGFGRPQSVRRVTTLCYTRITRTAPSFFCGCLQLYTPSSTLRSASDTLSLQIPGTRLTAAGSRAFSVFCPFTWNDLPLPLRQELSLDSFPSNLKTFSQNNRPVIYFTFRAAAFPRPSSLFVVRLSHGPNTLCIRPWLKLCANQVLCCQWSHVCAGACVYVHGLSCVQIKFCVVSGVMCAPVPMYTSMA